MSASQTYKKKKATLQEGNEDFLLDGTPPLFGRGKVTKAFSIGALRQKSNPAKGFPLTTLIGGYWWGSHLRAGTIGDHTDHRASDRNAKCCRSLSVSRRPPKNRLR